MITLSREVTHLAIAAGHKNTEMYEVGKALADTYRERYPEVTFEVYETQGSNENAKLLNQRKVDFGIVLSDTVATEGVGALARLFEDSYMLFVRKDSGINSINDLRDRHIALPPKSSGQIDAFWYLMKHYGIGEDDIQVQSMQGRAANFAMKQRQVDAVFRISALGAEINWDLVKLEPDLKLISIEQAEALAIFHPVLRKGIIPVGAFRGEPALPIDNVFTVSEDTVLATRSDMNPSLVRRLTAMLFERKAALIQHSPFAGHVKPIDDNVEIALPLHEGARRFYDREKPSLLQQNSRVLSTMLYVITLMGTAFVALKSRLRRQRRVYVQEYNLRLINVSHDAETAESLEELVGPKKRLSEVMDEVIGELDSELVSSDEFARFSFTWRAAERVLGRRERELEAEVKKS